jgi:pimeloyl-ACP methyl ester carboxylesterase
LIDDSVDFANAWAALGVSVLLVEYRGYGRSEGEPSINTCRDDATEWFDRVAARPDVRGDLVLAHGFSLGGVFATELAALRPVAGLVLEGTVASLRQAARDRSIWILLTRERFDAETILRELDPMLPVLITHGRKDDIVPFHHFERLTAARPSAVAVAGDEGHIPLATWDRPDLLRNLLEAARVRADNALASPPAVSAP